MSRRHYSIFIAASVLFSCINTAHAIPVLQIGAPGEVPGTFAPYVNEENPTEDDTAIINGNNILVGGAYKDSTNTNVINLGGKFGDIDWSDFKANLGVPTAFTGHGAVLLATYSEDDKSQTSTSLTISLDGGSNYLAPFLSASTFFYPNNHAPLQDASVTGYFYFDIGNFSEILAAVPNFDSTDPDQTTFPGEIKSIRLDVSGINWVHFDVMAIEVTEQGDNNIKTTFDMVNNPGSHDVTWKDDGGGGGGDPVPEPGTLLLLGAGLAVLGGLKKFRK